jgi:hypothetical protein
MGGGVIGGNPDLMPGGFGGAGRIGGNPDLMPGMGIGGNQVGPNSAIFGQGPNRGPNFFDPMNPNPGNDLHPELPGMNGLPNRRGGPGGNNGFGGGGMGGGFGGNQGFGGGGFM